MGFLKKFFGKSDKTKKEVTDIPDVATLSYGYHTIPVDALMEGVKRNGTVKALCPKTHQMIQLKDLGESLILFDPDTGERTPFINYEGVKYSEAYNYIYGEKYVSYGEDREPTEDE